MVCFTMLQFIIMGLGVIYYTKYKGHSHPGHPGQSPKNQG